jgi:UrcA family protein
MKLFTTAFHAPNVRRAVILLVLGTATCAALESTARAGESGVRSTTVHYADLDVSKPAGMAAPKRRIRQAAEIVCGDPDARAFRLSTPFAECVSQATAAALTKVAASSGRECRQYAGTDSGNHAC